MKYFTVDLEDWFHLLDFTPTQTPSDWEKFESRVDYGLDKILAVLRANEIQATFFVLAWLGERRPELVRALRDEGHAIASHGYSHQLAFKQTSEEFYHDISKAKELLENIVEKEVLAYRAPGFSITEDNCQYLDLVHKAGYRIDSSIFPLNRAHGGLKSSFTQPFVIKFSDSSQLIEMPISTFRFLGKELIISGGGYFRIAPFWMLRNIFQNKEYLMTYFHPRDFDDKQPVLDGLSRVRAFKTYAGLKTSHMKLSRLPFDQNWNKITTPDDFTLLPVVDFRQLVPSENNDCD